MNETTKKMMAQVDGWNPAFDTIKIPFTHKPKSPDSTDIGFHNNNKVSPADDVEMQVI